MPFWEQPLHQLSASQWEQLCDGCGKCCLHKLEDEDTGEIYFTRVACRLLDTDTCRCQDYSQRKQLVPECIVLSASTLIGADAMTLEWLPETCAYRLRALNLPLPGWHPLVSGNPESVHEAGMSVQGEVISEEAVSPDDIEEHIIYWV